jgi:hypothetical protein
MKSNKNRLIYEAILNDKALQQLRAKQYEIYSLVTPMVILEDGKEKTIWIDETNNPLLPKINEMIDERINQIEHWFTNDD